MRIRRAIDRISHRGAEVAAIGTAGVGLFALGLDSDVSETQRRFVWRLLTILAGLVVAISLTGFFYLKRQQTSARADVYSDLNAIADLKMAQIVNWRNERLSDARFLFQAPFVARDVTALFARPESVEVRTGVSRWLDLMRMGGLYESAMLFDAQMNLRLELPGSTATRTPGPILRGHLAAALRSHDAVLTDLHRPDAGDPIHLDLIVPVIPSDPAPAATRPPPALSRPAPIAVIVLWLDPERFLFPLIQTWPTPSATAETMLVRREGDEVVYLNELRHRNGTALALRRPMSDPLLPAAMVARGERGVFEGVDYRGVPVLAAVRTVPDSPWMLVAKVDQAEAYAPIRAEAWRTGLMVSLLLVAVVLAAAYLWRQRHAALLRHELTLERERKALAERLALITRHANDIILLLDETGRIVEANDRALTSYGYTLDELRQLPPGGLRPPGAQENLPQQLDLFASREGVVFETVHRRRDGTTFPVEVSGRSVEIEGRQFSLGIYRDLTERKRAEEALQREFAMRRMLLENLPCTAMILRKGTHEIVFLNEAARQAGAAPGKTCYGTLAQRSDPCPFCLAPEVWATNQPRQLEVEYRGKHYEGRWIPLTDDLYVHYIFDITEHKRAEESLRVLSLRLIRAKDEERRRIARELHDSTGQKLAALSMTVGLLQDATGAPGGKTNKMFSDCLAMIEQCAQEIRTHSYLLHPPLLDELGLAAAIRNYVEGFSKRSGVQIALDAPPDLERLPTEVELALFRVVQESLGNIHRHAGASTARIRLACDAEQATLEVTDQGHGMSAETMRAIEAGRGSAGVGIAGMQERLRLLGGRLEIKSGEQGTMVRAIIPQRQEPT